MFLHINLNKSTEADNLEPKLLRLVAGGRLVLFSHYRDFFFWKVAFIPLLRQGHFTFKNCGSTLERSSTFDALDIVSVVSELC